MFSGDKVRIRQGEWGGDGVNSWLWAFCSSTWSIKRCHLKRGSSSQPEASFMLSLRYLY